MLKCIFFFEKGIRAGAFYISERCSKANNKQNQPPRGFPRKRCSENIQQIYRRAPIPKCNFNKVAKLQNNFIEIVLRYGCSPVNFLHIFRTHFLNSTSWRLLLKKYPTSYVPKKLTTYITYFDKLGHAMTESLLTADLSVCILRNLG